MQGTWLKNTTTETKWFYYWIFRYSQANFKYVLLTLDVKVRSIPRRGFWKDGRARSTRQGCPLSLLLFNIVLEVLATEIREEKRNSNWKGRNRTVTADDMILYLENLKDDTRKLLEHINEFGKVAGYRLIHRNQLYFYILYNKTLIFLKKIIPFSIGL